VKRNRPVGGLALERHTDCAGRRGIAFGKVMVYEKMCIFADENNVKKDDYFY
jgi:hypothetical protein